jgi:anti-anti-sigma factor
MKLKFWGVRGSIPAPISSQLIEEKVKSALQEAAKQQLNLQDSEALAGFLKSLLPQAKSTIGGNTTCITLETEDHLIIFDAGSGMRELGRYLMKREFGKGQGKASIFFTHTHWDHIQGFPFFMPAFIPGNQFDIYHIHPYVPQVLQQQMVYEVYPVEFQGLRADMTFHQIQETDVIQLGDVRISSIELQHPGKAYSFRMDSGDYSLVLATDSEYKQLGTSHTKRYIDFYQGADILIFDAQFSVREAIIKEDWGHSSGLIGADIAKAAQVKQLILFHHDPTSTDEEILQALKQTREYLAQYDEAALPHVEVAREGWELTFKKSKEFTIEENDLGGVLCLSLSGHFDAQASEKFNKYLLDLAKNGDNQRLILDMLGLEELTMAGVRALLDARSDVYSLAMVNVPDSIHRVIELAGTTDFFAIYDSINDVVEAMSPPLNSPN